LVTTQSEPAEDEACEPPLDPLPTVTELPEPPGDTVVEPLTAPLPEVIVVELPLWPDTTRQGLPSVVTEVWPPPAVTATLSASAGPLARRPTAREIALIGRRILSSFVQQTLLG